MRVLELKPVSQQTMGKKKHKLRKQSQDNEVFHSDSSDEAAMAGATGRGCLHVSKSINFSSMRKAIKQQTSIGECTVSDERYIAHISGFRSWVLKYLILIGN